MNNAKHCILGLDSLILASLSLMTRALATPDGKFFSNQNLTSH